MLLAEVGIGTDADATRIDISEYGISVRYRSIPVPDWVPLSVPDWFWYRHYF
jgi:hypothetical protein